MSRTLNRKTTTVMAALIGNYGENLIPQLSGLDSWAYARPMLTLYGVAVTAENARHIVATLILDGSPDALDAPR